MSTFDIITLVGTILFGVSEGLASIPSVKANSVFQVVYAILKQGSLIGKLFSKK